MTLEQILKPRLAHHILLSLLHKPHYREKWMRHVQRRRGNEVNQRAVASFIASQLSDQTHQEISPASIKDRISRALTGDVISDSTAQMFITAFEFAPQEVQELQRALLQHQMALKIAQADDKNLSSPSDYTIMSSFLEAYIDEYGYITHFISTEVIRAEADVVTEFFPRFESETAWLSLLEGGELAHISTSKRQDAICGTNTFWKMKVTLEHPLTRGQVHQVRYRVDLDPKFTALNDTEPYYTVSMGPFAIPRYNVSLALYFAAPPLDIRRIIWAGEVEDKNKLEDTPLAQGTYYSYSYPLIEDTLLAFRWKSQREKALAKYRLQS